MGRDLSGPTRPSGAAPMPRISPPEGPSRRGFLRAGAFSLGTLGLSDLYRLRAAQAGASAGPDTAVILLWLPGGPPHMETYDLKPDAPAEFRGAFRPIPTVVPG